MPEVSTLVVIGAITVIALGTGIIGTARIMTGRKSGKDDN